VVTLIREIADQKSLLALAERSSRASNEIGQTIGVVETGIDQSLQDQLSRDNPGGQSPWIVSGILPLATLQ
jgi:hypothetical protein